MIIESVRALCNSIKSHSVGWSPYPVMTLLAYSAYADTSVFAHDSDTENNPNAFGNRKNDCPTYCAKQSPTEPNKPVSSQATITESKHRTQKHKQKRSKKTRRKDSNTTRMGPMEIETARLEIGMIPKETQCITSFQVMEKENMKGVTNKIPKEISFHSSSPSVDSDLESEARPRIRRKPSRNIRGNKRERDFHNKCICLELLESERFDDNCIGMEHLVSITNHELVNSSQFVASECRDNKDSTNRSIDESSLLTSSIAHSLVCNSNTDEDFSNRLRAIFPSFLCDHLVESDTVSFTPPYIKSTSCYRKTGTRIRRMSKDGDSSGYSQSKSMLKLPALRILVSSLEFVSRTTTMLSDSSTGQSSQSMDLLDGFWRLILTYMTKCLQDLVVSTGEEKAQEEDEFIETINREESSNPHHDYHHQYQKNTIRPESSSIPCSVEAALVVKGFRLLHKLQPEIMSPYVRYSLLPFVSNAREFGFEQQQLRIRVHRKHHRRSSSGDKMLARECERLLRSIE